MNLSRTLLPLLLLAQACVTAPHTPKSRAEAELRAKAEFLCQHGMLHSLALSRFPEGVRPEDYARREDVSFLREHPEKAPSWPLDKHGLPEELARDVRCEVTGMQFVGDTVAVPLRKTQPGMPTANDGLHFVWTPEGWRVGYWLPEAAAVSKAPSPDAASRPTPSFEKLTPPKALKHPDVQYTREALDRGVQGLLVAKCIITREGTVERCHLLRPLPFLNEAALTALQASRFEPATQDGEPIAIDYVFKLLFRLPNR